LGPFGSPNYAEPDVMSNCGAPKTSFVSPIRHGDDQPVPTTIRPSYRGLRDADRDSCNIDTMDDWARAEALVAEWGG
jgi:hypothetical protein